MSCKSVNVSDENVQHNNLIAEGLGLLSDDSHLAVLVVGPDGLIIIQRDNW
jgi:hypothetical protein